MKKLLLTLALSAATAVGFAQGTLNTLNTSTTLISTNGSTSGAIAGGAGLYYFAVLIAPMSSFGVPSSDNNFLDGTWSFVTMETNIASAGRINGGTTVSTAAWGAGVTNSYVILGWSASLGTTWSEFTNNMLTAASNGGNWTTAGYFGYSSITFGAAGGVTGTGTLPAYTLFGSGPYGQGNPLTTGFVLSAVPVPEPTTIALAGLGGVALLAFRRRKA